MKGAASFRPRIAYDRRTIGWRQGTGIHRFRQGLHEAIAAMAVEEIVLSDHHGGGMTPKVRVPAAPLLTAARLRQHSGENVNHWVCRDVFRRAYSRFTLTGRIAELRLDRPPDIVHWSHPLPMFVPGAANIYTVHDLIPLEHPMLSAMSGAKLARLLDQILPRAAHIMTVSETVRHSLARRFDLGLDRVTCCYQPIGDPAPGGILPKPLSKGAFLLCLGRFEPRKNVARLIEAHRRTPMALPLVFAGPDGAWPDRREYRRVMQMVDDRQVIRLGWQAPAVVTTLIAQCHALLMPSLAEGFGLPVVEAMRAGVPAMTSCRGAGAEIAHEAALRVDPESVQQIADGIAMISSSQRLRNDLRHKGVERAQYFSPKVFGNRLADLYETVSGAPIRVHADIEWGPSCGL